MASVEHDSILPRTVSDSLDINRVQILIDLTSSDSRYCSSHSLGSIRVLLVKIPNVSSHSTHVLTLYVYGQTNNSHMDSVQTCTWRLLDTSMYILKSYCAIFLQKKKEFTP
jgi:hypothetical protein